MHPKYDVVGLGNALMDALYRLDDDTLLDTHSLNKGQMHMVDDARWQEVYQTLNADAVSLQTGGSCANTIATMGLMGSAVSYCSQVSTDAFGEEYAKQLTDACGGHDLSVQPGVATGKCLSLISRDAERTLLTDLGTAITLDNIHHFEDSIRNSKILYLTGYLMFGDMRQRMDEAIAIAKDAGILIGLDVADPSVVELLREPMLEIIKNDVDIVFLNEKEAQAMCGGEPEDAIAQLRSYCDIVVVKLGKRGSMACRGEEVVRADIVKVEAIDTTGAGDSYAAGFLYGLTQGWPLQQCAILGSAVASQAVAQLGAVVRNRALLRSIIDQTNG